MRLAVLSPTFPPDRCGIGDYSSRIVEEFLNLNHFVGVFTNQQSPLFIHPRLSYYPLSQSWRNLKDFRPDRLMIQYIPYLYSKKWGIHFFLPLWVLCLRFFIRKPILLIVHELHYPIQFNPKGLLIGIPQFLQFIFIALLSSKISFTFEAPYKIYSKLFFWKKVFLIPVGANIKRVAFDSLIPLDEKISRDTTVLLHFGGSHPTNLFHYEFAALGAILQKFKNVNLFYAGLTQNKIDTLLEFYHFTHLRERITALGFLSEQEVSAWITRSNLILAPFLDGISTRRTSAMAALEHEKPLLTTRSWSTNTEIPWEDFCYITPIEPSRKFNEMAISILEHPKEAEQMGHKAKLYYDKNFSYPVITHKLLQALH